MDVDAAMYVESSLDEAAYEPPADVGDAVFVTGMATVVNSTGGTTTLRHDGLACEVTRAWWDYETGWRFAGRISDADAVASAREQSTSAHDADHYRRTFPNNPGLAQRAEKAAAEYDPSVVYFSEHDLAPAPAPGRR